MRNLVFGLITKAMMSSCSVQQFAVNIQNKPFQNGGKVWGERVEKCDENSWKSEFKKDKDIHVIGIIVRKSNVSAMVEELNAVHYTIETKSNLIVQFLTFGIVDYKTVKVIKRNN